jgi:phosphoribosylamine--glycine ligase
MKVLVIGSGGREHALCWKLAQSPRVSKLYCAPGNPGTARLADNVPLAVTDLDGLRDFAKREGVDFTVVGPEVPLCAGVVDVFESAGLRIFGPNRSAARLEGSKVFSKELLQKYGIPTAKSGTFTRALEAYAFSQRLGFPQVIKADGLAAGKGVIIALTPWEACLAIHDILERGVFGAAGASVLIEEFLTGEEASLHLLVSGTNYAVLPGSQDHKRVGDGDSGPNTGGMGAYAPAPVLSAAAVSEAEELVVRPFLAGLVAEGIAYRGVLYVGLMMTADGPKVLEFNCRFGDPETQVLLPMIEGDLLELLEATAAGRLETAPVPLKPGAAVCVVMAAHGYPSTVRKGDAIEGVDVAESGGAWVFQAGTSLKDGVVVTDGGRVLGVTAQADSLRAALDRVYAAVEQVRFAGAHFRRDIAARALTR